MMSSPNRLGRWLPLAAALCGLGCSSESEPASESPSFVAVTFNTGTSQLAGDPGQLADQWYGNGLAWLPVVEDARQFFAATAPDVVVFQEIFHSGECPNIPPEHHAGFVCESWMPGDPTVAQIVLGTEFQVACHLGKPDKCAGVRKSFGHFAGCDADLCLDGLDGAEVPDCGSGSRVGRGVIELEQGGTLTLVNVHGSSGLTQEDQDCRVKQFAQVFVDLGTGDGLPAASGERNLVMGDLNTDPGRMADFDESAKAWNDHVGPDERFHFVTDVGPDVPPSYGGAFNIDHVVSDAFGGSCWVAGLTDGHAPVSETTAFDHKPVVCSVGAP